jgi:hypothetical protein
MAFEKGRSGNPGGRPKGPSLKAELIRHLGRKGEDGVRHADAIALTLIDMARDGNLEAIREILDRVDGKVPQQQQVTGDGGGPVRVESYDIRLAVASIAPGPVSDRLAPIEAEILGDGASVGEDDPRR